MSSARAPMLADDFFASNEYTEYSEHRTPSKYFLVMNISFPCCSSLLLRCWRACFSNVRNSFFVSSHLRWLLAVGCSCWSWSWTYLVNATAHLYSNYGRCFTLTRRKTEDFILINAAAFLVPKSSRHNFESEWIVCGSHWKMMINSKVYRRRNEYFVSTKENNICITVFGCARACLLLNFLSAAVAAEVSFIPCISDFLHFIFYVFLWPVDYYFYYSDFYLVTSRAKAWATLIVCKISESSLPCSFEARR